MRPSAKISFRASRAPVAQQALDDLTTRYGQAALEDADAVVALGGDGFMLETLETRSPPGQAGLWHEPGNGRLPDE